MPPWNSSVSVVKIGDGISSEGKNETRRVQQPRPQCRALRVGVTGTCRVWSAPSGAPYQYGRPHAHRQGLPCNGLDFLPHLWMTKTSCADRRLYFPAHQSECRRGGRTMRGDGRIYQRGGVYYIAYSIGGREFRESTGSRDVGDAQRRLTERLRDRDQAQRAIASAPGGTTFDDLADAFVNEYTLREHRTIVTARARVDHLRHVFGRMLVAAITAAQIT